MQRRDPEGTETAAIAELVELGGKRVVDVGCGGGRMTVFAARHAASVYAFDPSAENVAKAKSGSPCGAARASAVRRARRGGARCRAAPVRPGTLRLVALMRTG